MKDTSELQIRKLIYRLIGNYPGLNQSKIAEILDISSPLALYHLRYLEKNDLIIAEKKAGYTRYYIKGKIGIQDKQLLSLFRQETPLRLILFN